MIKIFVKKYKERGFTLIELMVVIVTISVIAAVIFFAINPAKRIGDAQNAIRAHNAEEIKRGVERLIADSSTLPNTLNNLVLETAYMMVTPGGSTAGQCSCTTLDSDIDRIDLSSTLGSYVTTWPVDDSASGDDTGFYIKRYGTNSFDVGHCYEYSATASQSESVPLVAASQGPYSPGTTASTIPGTSLWGYTDNAKVNDGVATTNNSDDWDYQTVESEVKIIKADGTIGTSNKASLGVWGQTANPGYTTYGGAADTWGETWTAADINDADFGVALKLAHTGWDTHYLKLTNFGFSIPSNAVIDGIKVDIERWRVVEGGEEFVTVTHILDHARITIYYRS